MRNVWRNRRAMTKQSMRDNRIMKDITGFMLEAQELHAAENCMLKEYEKIKPLSVGMPADHTLMCLTMAVKGTEANTWYIRQEYRTALTARLPTLKMFKCDPNTVRDSTNLVRAYRASKIHRIPFTGIV